MKKILPIILLIFPNILLAQNNGWISTAQATVKTTPNLFSEENDQLYYGSKVLIVEETGDYFFIEYNNGNQIGYIDKKHVSKREVSLDNKNIFKNLVKSEYDEFTGITTYSYSEALPIDIENASGSANFVAIILDQNDELKYNIAIYTSINTSSGYTNALIDGLKRSFKGTLKRDSKRLLTILYQLNKDDFKQLANAETVRLRVDETIYNIPGMVRKPMQAMLTEIDL